MTKLNRFDHGGDIYSQRVELDFSVNVNPMGMPPAVRQAVIDNVDSFASYPDPKCRELTACLARFLGIPAEWLLFGNGAADLVIRLCLELKPKSVLVCAPTFSEYEKAALMAGAEVRKHLLPSPGFALDESVFAALDQRPDMFFLCNPNNPTGRLTPPALIAAVADECERLGIWFVIDECFLEFTSAPSSRPLLPGHPHMVILDAFTKMYAIAGLRLGYVTSANAGLLARVGAFGQSWNVSGPAQAAGIAAVGCGREWIDATRAFVARENAYLRPALRELGFCVYDGAANYTMFRSEIPLAAPMLERGILIRSCANYTGLDEHYYRVGVKGRAENERLVAALGEAVGAARH